MCIEDQTMYVLSIGAGWWAWTAGLLVRKRSQTNMNITLRFGVDKRRKSGCGILNWMPWQYHSWWRKKRNSTFPLAWVSYLSIWISLEKISTCVKECTLFLNIDHCDLLSEALWKTDIWGRHIWSNCSGIKCVAQKISNIFKNHTNFFHFRYCFCAIPWTHNVNYTSFKYYSQLEVSLSFLFCDFVLKLLHMIGLPVVVIRSKSTKCN